MYCFQKILDFEEILNLLRGEILGNIEKFNEIADRYDTPERAEIAKIIADKIKKYIINGSEKDAIDYGCGTGLVGMELVVEFRSLLFVDASSNMVDQVKNKIILANIQNADVLCCDFEEQSSIELRADYIIVAQTLLHIKEIKPVLSRLFEILNKGGHLLIVDFDKNNSIVSDEVHSGFDREELADILKKIGFLNVYSETFYKGSKMFMNQDASLFILDAVK